MTSSDIVHFLLFFVCLAVTSAVQGVFKQGIFHMECSCLAFSPFDSNQLQCVPDWACEAKKLEVLDMSYNLLVELPSR